MITFICLFFPPVISVWFNEYLRGKEFKGKQWIYQYILANIVINFLCFLIKRVLLGTGTAYMFDLYTDITPSAASNYLIMALPLAVIFAVCNWWMQNNAKQYINKETLRDFAKARIAAVSSRNLLGLLLGLIFFCVFYFYYGKLKVGLMLFSLFLAAGLVRCKTGKIFWEYTIFTGCTCLILLFLLIFPYYELFEEDLWEYIRTYNTRPEAVFVINGLLVLSVAFFANIVFNNWKISMSITTVLCAFLTVINGYIYRFRGKEFIFPDIFSVRTAANVAGQYDMGMKYHTCTMLVMLTLLLFSMFSVNPARPKRKLRGRIASMAAAGILFTIFCYMSQNFLITTWKWDGTLMNGYYLNFYISAKNYFVKEPEIYSDEQIEMLEEKYDEGELQDKNGKKPNVIVIMNESFADFDVLGEKVQTNKPVMPFLDSLSENTIRGYALTSVFGGSTANSEFEFLTGFTMQFLPDGAVPYQQYIHRSTHSLAWVLRSYGYRCMATHPYLANGWNRQEVYPYLGFQESTFLEAYPSENLIRSYVSDQEMYEYILTELKNENDEPLFLFGITMQNHGGYSKQNEFEQEITLTGYSEPYPEAEVYLSLVNQSDIAFEYLLTELEKIEEETIVLFFGDHFPRVEQSLFEELHNGQFDTLDSQMKQYMVPFVIWANYDIDEQTVERTSLNYLGRYLLENAGLELTPFYKFQKEMERVVPALNAMGYYSCGEEKYLPADESNPEVKAWLEQYKVLQYNGLFEKKNISPGFFLDYIRETE